LVVAAGKKPKGGVWEEAIPFSRRRLLLLARLGGKRVARGEKIVPRVGVGGGGYRPLRKNGGSNSGSESIFIVDSAAKKGKSKKKSGHTH